MDQTGFTHPLKKTVYGYAYIVREGDTLADVLRVTGASARELAARNARHDLFHLTPGQRLRVPSAAISAFAYRVRRGEDVYALARKLDRSVVSLLRVNPHLLPVEIRFGARIALPED